MKKTESAGGIVVRNGKILLVSQKGTSWCFPKGHVDEGEDKLETAKREIYEESGVSQLEMIKELGSYQRYKGDDKNSGEFKTIFLFLFHTAQAELKPVDPANPEAKWIDKDRVVNVLTFDKDKEFYLSVLDKII